MVKMSGNRASKKRKRVDCLENEDVPIKRRLLQPGNDDDENFSNANFSGINNNDGAVSSENAVSKCLRNNLVLATIFERLPYHDVSINCIRVNKTWNQIANQFLGTIKIFHIQFTCQSKRNYDLSFREVTQSCIYWREIEYKDAKEGRMTPLSLIDLAILDDELYSFNKKEVWVELDYECKPAPFIFDSLSRICPWMTRLTIDHRPGGFDEFNYLPLDAPMLQHLHVKRMPNRNKLPLPSESLSRLTTISFSNYDLSDSTTTLQRILATAQNVESILNFPLKNVAVLEDNERAQSKVKTMNIPKGNLNTREFSLLVSIVSNIHLDKFSMNWSSPVRRKWTREELRCPWLLPTYFASPAMCAMMSLMLREDVENLSVFSHNCGSHNRCPNNEVEVTAKFPNSNSLEIDLGKQSSLLTLMTCLPDKLLGNGYSCRSIRHLKISEYIMKGWTSKVVKILPLAFPNVKTFDVGRDKVWMETCLPSIWQGWSDTLEELSLTIQLNGGRYLTFPFLDEAITGIPETKCKHLRNVQEKQVIQMNDLKSLSGISDMKVLKKFSITLNGYDLNWGSKAIVSHVAAFYGFQLLPELKVMVQIPSKSHFKTVITKLVHPIIPHVTFCPDYVSEEGDATCLSTATIDREP